MDKPLVTVEIGELLSSCFVIMPFAATYQSLYDRVIRSAIEDAGLMCIRGDEVFAKSQITDDIWKQVRSCRLVLAELTGKNPNVLYELGLAHAIGKPSIIITRNQEDVPFDLRALRYLYYDVNDPFWGDNLKTQLTEMCRKVLEQRDFGSVFDGIEFLDAGIPPVPPTQKKPEAPPLDISGVWHGKFMFEGDDYEHSWNLHLTQHENIITGTLVVSFIFRKELSVVQQAVSGEVTGQSMHLHGTSYSYLHRGASPSYCLDSFNGTIAVDVQEIHGTVEDVNHPGKLKLSRVSLDDE